jgi:tetratricopeptide (TPR) repeat protein
MMEKRPVKWHKDSLVHILCIVVLGLIVYSNTINAPFVFDDKYRVVENPIIKDLGYFLNSSEVKVFESYEEFRNRYVGYLTFALNYKLHGLNVIGYHVFNIALHVLNAALVYWIVILTFSTPILKRSSLADKKEQIALFTGLLFVSHPLQTQAVTYIVQRVACLATTFYLLSLGLYVRWKIGKQRDERHEGDRLEDPTSYQSGILNDAYYLLSLISAALAMKTKEIAFTLPLAVSLYECMFFRDILKKRTIYLVPFLLLMLVVPLSIMDLEAPVSEIVENVNETTKISKTPRVDYMLTELRVLVTYLRLLVLPVGQNVYYDYPVFHSFFDPQVLFSFIFLSAIMFLAVFLYYRSGIKDHSSRLIAFGVFWFFLALSVESSIVPLHPIYEHRVYLPSAGILIALTTLLFLAVDKWRQYRLPLLAILTAVIVVFSATAYARNNVWQSEISLWEDTAGKSPHRARVQNNLGSAYISAGMFDKAERHLNIALALKPDFAMAYNNLGLLYSAIGQEERALKNQMMAIGLDPEFSGAHYDVGSVYMAMGMPEKAVEHYRAAIKLNPGYAEAYHGLGTAYLKKSAPNSAIESFMTAIRLNPGYVEAHNGLGSAYLKKGKRSEAEVHYLTAIRLKPDFADAHFNLGVIYLMQGSTELAEDHFYNASVLRPDFTDSRFNLGIIYLKRGQKKRARRAFEDVLKINPDEREARRHLELLEKESR